MIIKRVDAISIGVTELPVYCPCCEQHSEADILVVAKYFNVYFIPLWPVTKEANCICKVCGLKRYGISFDKRLISNYDEIEHSFKYPWFLFIGAILFGCLFLTLIVRAVL